MPFKSNCDDPESGGGCSTPGSSCGCDVNCTISLTSQTIAPSPADRARTKIGVGEEVRITSADAQGSVKWTVTGNSKISSRSGASVRLTAADRAESTTVEATDSKGCTASLTFDVVEPSHWTMQRRPGTPLKHVNPHPDCGFAGMVLVHPNDVNFYNIEVREKESTATATGSYAVFNGMVHGHYPPPDFVSPWGTPKTHRDADGTEIAGVDLVYSGIAGPHHTGSAVPFTPGKFSYSIVWQWRVGTGTPADFPPVTQEHEITSDGNCRTSKGGHSETILFSDPSMP